MKSLTVNAKDMRLLLDHWKTKNEKAVIKTVKTHTGDIIDLYAQRTENNEMRLFWVPRKYDLIEDEDLPF